MKQAEYTEKSNSKSIKKRAYSIFLPIFFLSLFLAALVISVTNDMYAFFKSEHTATIEILNPMSIEDISKLLQENNIISNPFVFSLYAKNSAKKERLESFTGRLELSSQLSYRDLVNIFS